MDRAWSQRRPADDGDGRHGLYTSSIYFQHYIPMPQILPLIRQPLVCFFQSRNQWHIFGRRRSECSCFRSRSTEKIKGSLLALVNISRSAECWHCHVQNVGTYILFRVLHRQRDSARTRLARNAYVRTTPTPAGDVHADRGSFLVDVRTSPVDSWR